LNAIYSLEKDKMMRVAIHQPNFLPWIGYFYKMASCDLFIYLDDVQFTKNSYQNRVKIKTPQGGQWLTLPVLQNFGQLTNEVKINNKENWRDKHLRTLEMNYKKTPGFPAVYDLIKRVYECQEWSVMSDLNIALIEEVATFIGLKTPRIKSSELAVSGSSTDRLVNLVKKFNGTTYLSGSGGSKYQEEALFTAQGIEVHYSDFIHPVYPQPWGEFIKGASIVDFLFNHESGTSYLNLFKT